MADLLLHSMSCYSEIFQLLLDHVQPKSIVEVGSEYAGSTKFLARYAKDNGLFLHVVDPEPYIDVDEVLSECIGCFKFHRKLSIDAFSEKEVYGDIYFLDGDHNYWTVKTELELIYKSNPQAWVALHDVGFPWARRDLYYSPRNIPDEYINEYTYDYGVGVDSRLIYQKGFRGAGRFALAKSEATPGNGVLTAVEDFVTSSSELYYTDISPIFGLGIVCPASGRDFIDSLFAPYKISMIDEMERNRIELYLKVLELQDRLNGQWLHRFSAWLKKNLCWRSGRC